jgi:hypothetical protein
MLDRINLSKKGKKLEFLLALFLVLFGITLRLLPHSPNFAPIGALALFGGIYLSKRLSLILPISAMLVSDLFIGFYEIPLMVAVYLSFLLTVLLGKWLKKRKNFYSVGGGAILASLLFFLITNFAVWVFTPWYLKTFSGLLQAYLMALPFFKNTLFSNLFYTTLFFGVFETGCWWIKRKFIVPQMV